MSKLDDAKRDLAIANRILAAENVVDAYGHVAMRHPEKPDHYLISRSRSPALVTPDDIMEYTQTGDPVNDDRRGYGERHIHGAILERNPGIQATIHNHSLAVIPFGVTGTPIKPLFHCAAGMGDEAPIWDIRDKFGPTNMLVMNMEQGRDLATCMGDSPVCLMRGHGCAVHGRDLKAAVMIAVYLQVNAQLQTVAMNLGDINFLTPEEGELHREILFSPLSVDRVWEYFQERADLTGI